MTHVLNLRKASTFKWVSSVCVFRSKTSLWPLLCDEGCHRFYGRKRIFEDQWGGHLNYLSLDCIRKAQAALLEYLHSTRNLHYLDAEHISKNSPFVLGNLLQKVDTRENIGQALTRYLRFNPINEFEPFFESLGLKPYEYAPFLPPGLIFLGDDSLLLENYHVFCDYGIARNKIGKIYMGAVDVFKYGYGVLSLRLQAYEELGLSRSFISRLVVASPYLLIGDLDKDFLKVLEVLKRKGIKLGLIEEYFSEKSSCNWSKMLLILNLFRKMGCSEEQLGELIRQHPSILFEDSGNQTFALLRFLTKFGSTIDEIYSMFLRFPEMEVGKFVSNLRQCFLFLNDIEMESQKIGKIVRSYPLLMGSCTLKRTSSLLRLLSVGKKRLCELIQENPQEMKKWVLGSRVQPLSSSGEKLQSEALKIKFSLNFFRGKGAELQERFDCILKTGLDKKDVCHMVRIRPEILQQKKDVILMKINILVNDFGYPISSLVKCPSYLCCNIQKAKLRLAMYNWLKDQGTVDPTLSLNTVVASSERIFVNQFVIRHPKGPEIVERLREEL
ncbi:hypothetical protein K2173_025092 [Erythroxylum novogranatense]|uniref:Uncharacterized protein n=1 Tax=Erythroxylum novogranatense TaxID=1862640 RepID=A0AAV8SVG7_9ROSI|nr:hypothetical protein K2173_025092 [Erythroxylum novogranatense]